MSYLLFIVGLLIAFLGFVSGFGVTPMSAPQQAVQGIDLIIGVLGVLIAAVGAVVYAVDQVAAAARENGEAARAAAKPVTAPVVVEAA